jgi:hypothetical protein
MLKEINRISREMLFMHGHLTRPIDWTQNADSDRDHPVKASPAPPRRSRRSAMLAACCVAVPLINVQIR